MLSCAVWCGVCTFTYGKSHFSCRSCVIHCYFLVISWLFPSLCLSLALALALSAVYVLCILLLIAHLMFHYY